MSYPSGVGMKFNIDGSVRAFPGNTIICHLPQTSKLSAALLVLYEQLRSSTLAHLYTLLPPPSWHMTMFEGVLDALRSPGFWPDDIPVDAALGDCDQLFERKLAIFDLAGPPHFDLEIAGWQPLIDGIGLRLRATNEFEEDRMRRLRDRLSETLQIRHPQHDTYVFHLSIAYLIRHPTDFERNELSAMLNGVLSGMPSEFSLGAPEFCRFEDMFEFRRKLYLENQSKTEPVANEC